MKISDHGKICLEKFGDKFTLVHEYLDQYFAEFGPAHRGLLHHQQGVELIVEKFGEVCRRAAEQHIKDDTQGYIPPDWGYYGEPYFLKLEHYNKYERILRKLYKLI